MPTQESCPVLRHEQIAPHVFRLTLLSSNISQEAQPGQFVNVRVSGKYDPLLRRPLSIHRTERKKNSFQLLYEVVGKGTTILSQIKPGDKLDVLGPLGKGFSLPSSKQNVILVGGGMGIAPLLFLAEKLKCQMSNVKCQMIVLIGAKTKQQIYCEADLKKLANQLFIATDDGSYGQKGFVSDALSNQITTYHLPLTTIFACGPHPMLEAVANIARRHKIPCQVSMEAKMACGIGTCMGCVIKTKSGYKKVCDDGPVFDTKEIIWD